VLRLIEQRRSQPIKNRSGFLHGGNLFKGGPELSLKPQKSVPIPQRSTVTKLKCAYPGGPKLGDVRKTGQDRSNKETTEKQEGAHRKKRPDVKNRAEGGELGKLPRSKDNFQNQTERKGGGSAPRQKYVKRGKIKEGFPAGVSPE